MTLEAVAKRARVSTATVSRVLNNLGTVKDSTRRRVMQAVEDLNYYPNLHARSLAGGRTSTMGMIVSNISNPFFADIFLGMESAAEQAGYEVLIEHTNYRTSHLVAGVRSMIGRRVAGLALIVSEMEEAVMEEVAACGLPAVFYDVGSAGERITNIRVKYESGMHRIVEYLYALGHRRMAFLGHHASLAPLEIRKNAFTQAIGEHEGEVEFAIAVNDDTPVGGMQATHELLASGFEPTAIVCVNDYMAIGALRAVHARGLSVPADMSVTGFDNIEFSEFTNPALTTANIPRRAIGEMAVKSLLDQKPGREILIEPELVLRDSTGPCRVAPIEQAGRAG
jgi:DNA-binding LacI/PurR family transcriptional regulator